VDEKRGGTNEKKNMQKRMACRGPLSKENSLLEEERRKKGGKGKYKLGVLTRSVRSQLGQAPEKAKVL